MYVFGWGVFSLFKYVVRYCINKKIINLDFEFGDY